MNKEHFLTVIIFRLEEIVQAFKRLKNPWREMEVCNELTLKVIDLNLLALDSTEKKLYYLQSVEDMVKSIREHRKDIYMYD